MAEQKELYGGRELRDAVLHGDIERIEELYQQYGDTLDVNYSDDTHGHYPIISIANKQIAKLLLEYGTDINKLYNNRELTPLTYTCFARNWKITKLLLDNGADPNLGHRSALLVAVQIRDYEHTELMLQYGADPSYVMPIGYSTIEHVKQGGYSQRMTDLINGCTMTKSANKHYKN
jgi:ankyrin repeat protein